ncbi:MAG: extracellular solute-binding protein [Planctomycetota bacterium]|nr:extracellular solute-binding protein [Planctomycetota bacterium]
MVQSRIILFLMMGGALYILLLGPRSDPKLPTSRRSDVLIEYWEKWTGPEETQMREIVDDFNATIGSEKHIFVQYMSMSSIDQKTLIATSGGVPPDIAGLWHGTVLQFAALGALEPLEGMAAEHGITADYYKPVYWNACNYQGHLYALVSTPAAVALFYNRRIFRENGDKLRAAGLDPDRPPKTLAELDRYAAALDVFAVGADGRRHLQRAGYLPTDPNANWYIVNTPLWFGEDLWDPIKKRLTLTDPPVIKAFQWIQSFSKRLGADEVTAFSTSEGGFNSLNNSFIDGSLVMEQQGPWMANFIHEINPAMDHDWAAAPFPSAVPGLENVTFCPFDALMIPRGSKHKKEAFEFIAYVNRQDVMEKLCSMHCKNSPLAKVSDAFIRNHRNPFIRVFEDLAASQNAHAQMQNPIAPEVKDELMPVIEGITALKRDPATALAETQRRLQLKYEDFMRRSQ